jgi:NAD(P)H-dependent FMN reductase
MRLLAVSGGLPGSLKNALDWLVSSPASQEG